MRAGEEPEPVDEGGDPACWAHLFAEDGSPAESAEDVDIEGSAEG